MRIEELVEGLSPVLFHAVSFHKFIKMVNRKPPVLFTGRSGSDGRVVSFSRNRSNRFLFTDMLGESGIDLKNGMTVVIEFDGRELSNNYRGVSRDSFAPNRSDPFFDQEDYDDYEKDPKWDYMEDRILAGNRTEIPFKTSSVRAIHLIFPTDMERMAFYMDRMVDDLPKLRSKGFRKIEIYDSVEDYSIGRKTVV